MIWPPARRAGARFEDTSTERSADVFACVARPRQPVPGAGRGAASATGRSRPAARLGGQTYSHRRDRRRRHARMQPPAASRVDARRPPAHVPLCPQCRKSEFRRARTSSSLKNGLRTGRRRARGRCEHQTRASA
ncbi:MAG: hypothetical protein MZV65_37945 [Chromatiales bacterium]|nr:hypothetical protein [Chromatiales bacterium]